MNDILINAKIEEMAALLEFDPSLRREFDKAVRRVFRQAGHDIPQEVFGEIQITSKSDTFAGTVMAGPEGNP